MTTPQAETEYRMQHLAVWGGRPLHVHNPHNLPIEDLPVIYGFNNGGSPGWYSAMSLAEDGTPLAGHVCSHEGYMPHDLGMLEGSRPDRHEEVYQKHYPNGYRMEFVPRENIETHEELQTAFALANARPDPDPDPDPEPKTDE